jgi:hypothetical protein
MRAVPLALAVLLACSSAPADTSAPRAGTFRYSALSARGAPLLTGRLDFTFPDDSTLAGSWAITWLPGADTTTPVGPQLGAGNLVGTRHGDTLRVQLNPMNADHNVVLLAVAVLDGYAGQWQWITATGPRSAGRFVATSE